MKSNLRVVSVLALLTAGVVMAQATKSAPTHEQMEKAKAAMMEDRKQMMSEAKAVEADATALQNSMKGMQGDKVKDLEAHVAKLQADIKVLNSHLAQTPKYFDNPVSNNRP